jgi:hypothetical protein
MDEQDKINKDIIAKFEAIEKILENLDGKVKEVGSSTREVFIVIKMLETQVGQLVGRPMGSKGRLSVQPQGPETTKATQTHLGPEPVHEGSCCIRQDQRTKPACEDQKYDYGEE